ncbi:tripartite tricarboxylate transporter permease [Azospirillum endophyticum]
MPGETSSVVTTLDGHQLVRQRKANTAPGIAALGSFFAGMAARVLASGSILKAVAMISVRLLLVPMPAVRRTREEAFQEEDRPFIRHRPSDRPSSRHTRQRQGTGWKFPMRKMMSLTAAVILMVPLPVPPPRLGPRTTRPVRLPWWYPSRPAARPTPSAA